MTLIIRGNINIFPKMGDSSRVGIRHAPRIVHSIAICKIDFLSRSFVSESIKTFIKVPASLTNEFLSGIDLPQCRFYLSAP